MIVDGQWRRINGRPLLRSDHVCVSPITIMDCHHLMTTPTATSCVVWSWSADHAHRQRRWSTAVDHQSLLMMAVAIMRANCDHRCCHGHAICFVASPYGWSTATSLDQLPTSSLPAPISMIFMSRSPGDVAAPLWSGGSSPTKLRGNLSAGVGGEDGGRPLASGRLHASAWFCSSFAATAYAARTPNRTTGSAFRSEHAIGRPPGQPALEGDRTVKASRTAMPGCVRNRRSGDTRSAAIDRPETPEGSGGLACRAPTPRGHDGRHGRGCHRRRDFRRRHRHAGRRSRPDSWPPLP